MVIIVIFICILYYIARINVLNYMGMLSIIVCVAISSIVSKRDIYIYIYTQLNLSKSTDHLIDFD